jgi:hypothetical protein
MALLMLAQSNGPLFAMGGLMIFIIILALLATVFWVWMIIDILTSNMPSGDKVLWFLVVFFLHLLGAIIYYFVKRTASHGDTGRHALT